MKTINLLLSTVTLVFLSACGGGGEESTPEVVSLPPVVTPPVTTPPDSGDETSILVNTSDLLIPDGFDFTTEREVAFNLSVASSQSERGFMSVYTGFNNGVVDYNSQIIRTPMNVGVEFKSNIMIPNHLDKVWVEIWYPAAIGSEVKKQLDIVNGVVNAVL
ncbi:hypothetical protein HWQ46_21450 [Shewanella sp. D64]|uniref:hypothetical protein n=1 Tax=unclassified Shewanella TaxID=196818 RepID=UPI0022BA1DF0|nr:MULTISPECIES: hypothetical protein [unclassified Shewanella]MEC4728105.1 hypothetical protein [Shewanella sp. D64]MEC4740225.1 hypothetical protein [Shewanella sp. E94]WBJ94456.1 hypothetical protein HWQ47_21700 [Shewanella sp. MTB7]